MRPMGGAPAWHAWAQQGMGVPTSCLAVAHWIAPRPSTHRVYVIPLVLRWLLVLADAAC
jgi:hypothetical protein